MERLDKRVCALFTARFGAQLKIKWFESEKIDETVVQNWQTSFVYSRTRQQVSFPVFSHDQRLKAIAVAWPVDNSDVISFKDMEDFIQLTIAESVRLDERYQFVERSEEAYNLSHNDDNNVVRWPNSPNQGPKHKDKPNLSRKPTNLFDPIWIYGDDINFAGRLAIDVHEWVKNWAFFNVQELPDLFWQENEPWTKLVQATIFIPDADKLSPTQWQILESNLAEIKKMSNQKPMLILASETAPEKVQPKLCKQFKVYRYSTKSSANSQAHFILYQFEREKLWAYQSKHLKGLSFLPFSRSSDLLH